MDVPTLDATVGFRPIVGVDHPVIAVRSMTDARATFERLGFVVPPRGAHLEWGTGNWCVMMARDYLELRGIVDETRYLHGLDDFLARHGEGLMGCAFATEDGMRARSELMRRGLHLHEPRELTRRFELPDGDVPVRFRLFFFADGELPGLMSSLICEHLTPTVLRRPEWTVHPNGAQGVQSITAVASDLDHVASQMTRAFGLAAVSRRRGGSVVAADVGGNARYYAIRPDEGMRLRLIRDKQNATDRLVATAIRVEDTDSVRRLLDRNEVPYDNAGGDVLVAVQYACGMSLLFTSDEPYWAKSR